MSGSSRNMMRCLERRRRGNFYFLYRYISWGAHTQLRSCTSCHSFPKSSVRDAKNNYRCQSFEYFRYITFQHIQLYWTECIRSLSTRPQVYKECILFLATQVYKQFHVRPSMCPFPLLLAQIARPSKPGIRLGMCSVTTMTNLSTHSHVHVCFAS